MKPIISIKSSKKKIIIKYNKDEFPFHVQWLYEHSKNNHIRDTETGQLKIEAAEIAKDLSIINASIVKNNLKILFSDNISHIYSLGYLFEQLKDKYKENIKQSLWNKKSIKIPEFDFNKCDESILKKILYSVETYGFAYLKNIPTTKNGIQSFTNKIGPIKRTNWGEIADIKSIKNAYDLTMTARTLENHTDNPYRYPTQGYIFLHCLKNAEIGGENTLVDGFNAAKNIMKKDKKTFEKLSNYKTFFRYKDKDTCLEHACSLIELDDTNRIIQVRYNNRTEVMPYASLSNIKSYINARKIFWNEICKNENNLIIKQKPGDMIIIDNYRIFHGRKGYTDNNNSRYFRQGYMDRDIFQSKLKTMS